MFGSAPCESKHWTAAFQSKNQAEAVTRSDKSPKESYFTDGDKFSISGGRWRISATVVSRK